MKRALEIAQKLSDSIDKNCLSELGEANLEVLFKPIYRLPDNIITLNAIVAFVILAYDNDSPWLNLNQDRYDNKKRILQGLDVEITPFLEQVIRNDNDRVNDVIIDYLIEQTTWKWKQAMTFMDYHSSMIRFVSKKTETGKSIDEKDAEGNKITFVEEFDADTVAKANKTKGELLQKALEARKEADILLQEIRKEFVHMDNAVQEDFGFSITDEKKIDPLSWRDFIRHSLPKLKATPK